MNTAIESTEMLVDGYQVHFDQVYVAGIPNLLNDSGAFLSFLAVLSATEALAGLYAPSGKPGERFKEFVRRFYPSELASRADDLWAFRNAMVHSFNPGPLLLTHNNSRSHLSTVHGPVMLNAQDFYAALLFAYRGYFAALVQDQDLLAKFITRISSKDGGAMQTVTVTKNY
jgi:hypothetical protein